MRQIYSEWYHVMDEQGETPMSRAMKAGHPDLAGMVSRQMKEDAPEISAGDSLLQRAAYWGLDSAVRKLLWAGANPDVRDVRGETPLHKAVRRGHTEVVKALLMSEEVGINVADGYGMTPLHWVAINGRSDLAKLLLSFGADVTARERRMGCLTPLALAELMGYYELAEMIALYGGSW